MNDKINTFLNSDLLDKYLLGSTTTAETEMVETYISKYPEVQNAYNTLQHNLEIVAKRDAVEAPKDILNNIFDALDEETPVLSLNPETKQKKWTNYSIVASIAAFIFAGTTLFLYTQKQSLNLENQKVVDEIFDLRSDIDSQNKRLDDIMRQFKQLNNPETEKYIINGNNRAKNLKTVAYINPKEKKSMIDVVSLPQLPEEQCYQIWAEVQDKMVNLGILSETDRKLMEIPYTENALGLSITIEEKGSKINNSSKENAVAEISFQKNK